MATKTAVERPGYACTEDTAQDYNVAHAPIAARCVEAPIKRIDKLLVKIIDFGLAKAIHIQAIRSRGA